MVKKKTAHGYELELQRMIKSRTGMDMEPWLLPQVRATAGNMVLLDKMQDELARLDLVNLTKGSQGQQKNEANPLLPHYDKMQRTLLMQFESLGLNYSTQPSKVKEDVHKGVDTEKDRLSRMMAATHDMLHAVPDDIE